MVLTKCFMYLVSRVWLMVLEFLTLANDLFWVSTF